MLTISAFGAWARTVFCTSGGSALNFSETLSTLRLQPTSKLAASAIGNRYVFIGFVLPYRCMVYPPAKVGVFLPTGAGRGSAASIFVVSRRPSRDSGKFFGCL